MERIEKLDVLRRMIASYELDDNRSIVPLGHHCADKRLANGLRRNALHEIYAGDGSQGAAATGFAAGFASRMGENKTLFWISTEFCNLEYGTLNASGLRELGIDPLRIIVIALAKGEDVLRAAGDVLACRSVGAVVLQIAKPFKALDLTATRRLSLAAAHSDVSAILLRLGGAPEASAAETRWLVHAASSEPPNEIGDWGRPRYEAQLLRNRHGALGQWHLEWDCNDGFFGTAGHWRETADRFAVVSAAANRSPATEVQKRGVG
jgi:protein ImuA